MRTLFLSVISSVLIVSVAHAETKRFRPATEAQIMKHLKGAKDLKRGSDGFMYRSNGSTGYKISNGQICVKSKRSSVDCVQVKTDGTRFQMIDRRGTRENL